ncbi:hypothetical protein [Myxococcus stipitatus]|uniref:hypothetical protein n=1 Tax=Myxococcus stipitatus TaxID=83455 RepID=UPI0030D4D198
MKKHWMLSLFGASALALSLTACGDIDKLRGPETPDVTPLPGTNSDEPPTAERRFELRVRGTGTEGFTSLRLPISQVSVTTLEGKALPVWQRANVLELATAGHSPLLAHFEIPEGIERVRITLHFTAMGELARNGNHEMLDARIAPVSFESHVSDLSRHHRAVFALDMAHSVVPFGPGTVMLPSGVLQY